MDITRTIAERRGAVVAAAAVAPLLLCAALAALREEVPNASAALVLVVLIVAAAATGIRWAGLAAAASSALWFDVFLTEPYGQLVITDPADLEAVILLLIVGGGVTELALWGQRQKAALARERGYLDGVVGIAQTVALGERTPDEVIAAVARSIQAVLDLDACEFEPGGGVDPAMAVLEHNALLTRGGFRLNVERGGLPTDQRVVLPVRAAGTVHGRFLLIASSHVARPSREQRRVAVLLADQVASLLSRAAGSDSPKTI